MPAARRWWRYRPAHRLLRLNFWCFLADAAPLEPELEEFWSRAGFLVIQGYGLTGAAPIVSLHPFQAQKGSVGKLLPGVEVKIAPDGETVVRGEKVSSGYYSAGPETAANFAASSASLAVYFSWRGKEKRTPGDREVEGSRFAEARVMPTVKDIRGPYRFFFYSFDCNEPAHVHVRREGMVCKFWLEPVTLAANHGFSARELNRIRASTQENLTRILEAWHEHCG